MICRTSLRCNISHWNAHSAQPRTRVLPNANRQVLRAREDWIEIPVPAVISEDVFEAAGLVSRNNSKWSPRNADDDAWLLRGLVRCGMQRRHQLSQMNGRNGTFHRYYYCAFTTRSRREARSDVVGNATLAPTLLTPSSATRSGRRCYVPRCCWPERARSPPEFPP